MKKIYNTVALSVLGIEIESVLNGASVVASTDATKSDNNATEGSGLARGNSTAEAIFDFD